MDGLSSAASVIAIIQLAGSIVKFCGGYIQEVKDARDEIFELQRTVADLAGILQELKVLLQGPNGAKLSSSHTLNDPFTKCHLTLTSLEATVDPGKGKRVIKKLGFRAWKWPLDRIEVKKIIEDLERYKSSFTLSLAIDQTALLADINHTTDRLHCNMDLSQLSVAHDATFDSNVNQYEDDCLPGTRGHVLRQVEEWATSPQGKCIFWLNGRAGTGKSTIARTVAKTFSKSSLLGASFFFKRGEADRGHAAKLFPTIARQLARNIPQLVPGIQKAIHDDSEISTKGLKEQFDKLLLKPLLSLNASIVPIPTANDISLFLQHRLAEIKAERSMPIDWPTNTDFNNLVTLSVPLFIFAATACRLFQDPHWDPVDSLADILAYRNEGSKLEGMYVPVLNRLLQKQSKKQEEQLVQEFREVVGTIMMLESPLSVNTLSGLIGLPERLIYLRLSPLQSVLSVPEDETLPEAKSHEISGFLHDAKRFFLKNWQIADEMPLQLYCTGLVFAPKSAIIRKNFDRALPNWIRKFPDVAKTWSAELQTLEGHLGAVYSVAFSLDGRLLASGSWDKTIKLWDTTTGALQQTLEGHSDSCRSVVFSPDGSQLASGSCDKTIRLWDTATGALMQTFEGHSDSCKSVAFSPDSQLLVSGSEDKTVRLWNSTTKALQMSLHGHRGAVYSVKFSPDGHLLASGSEDKTIKIWDPTTGVLQQTLESHSGWVCSLAFSANGRCLASGSNDRTIRLWDTTTGILQQTLKGQDGFQSVAFLSDDRTLVSGSLDKRIQLWDTTTGALKRILTGHTVGVRSVASSPDSHLLASGSQDGTVRLWDTATETPHEALQSPSDRIRSMALSPDGRLLALGSDDTIVRLRNISTETTIQTLRGHLHWIWSVVFSPDGRLLASCSRETIRVWDVATGDLHQAFKSRLGEFRSIAFSADGRLLASGSCDKMVRVWDIAAGALKRTIEGHSGWVWAVAFSANGHIIASGSDDKTVRLWNAATGAVRQTLEGHSGWVRSVAFSANSHILASGSDDKTVRLWDIATGALRQTVNVEGTVVELQFSDDGTYLITNLGYISVQSRYVDHISKPLPTNAQIFIQGLQWITLQGIKALWLPPDFRPTCSTVKDKTLVLGHESGRISTIEFNL
ncbi:NACHT nucleoside triphosphatase [Penicillium subrubescens]|uniref:NACHT nucleoside triphosphatase n=1 Tax=Penicillium subrubescens TaxID=1316194 RepID=UPI0025457478|nr:NACHT nucleoside triphosphatase [Penicillium subrubescens]KAJ5890788.1 NACHT nucleoside triphosphatase [Penicillium subrubescens]